MKIEFKGELSDIDIHDHIIRDLDWVTEDDKMIRKPHLQARLTFKTNKDYDCQISYYDENNEFLGLDDPLFNSCRKLNDFPSSFTVPLNIPTDTERLEVLFTTDKDEGSSSDTIWGVILMTGAAAVVLGIAAWAFNEVASLFS